MDNKTYLIKSIDMSGFENNINTWLAGCGVDVGWILAYADDGVIWGVVKDGCFKLSSSIFPNISPQFRLCTLQQVRIFNRDMEIHVWRDALSFKGCLLEDGNEENELIEDYILLGNKIEDVKEGFTLLAVGEQGLRHALPFSISDNMNGEKPNRFLCTLTVKHYIDYDEYGQAYISASRMCGIKLNGNEVQP
ncbi:CRISPR-associated protein Csx19 [Mahella sp.]|uniref:type III-D CRISPR-associated protein Csx19 n=1 Tax=Mahella sp. TaxID=2798721 RepID=UPI0025C1FDA8|nr:CRISPR-associated protein Csx19 [Mahella sp.]MBZ4665024.1 hypothetical protein [Mahella sp.]MDK2903760.1 hypothetical protein [Clostridiales bacterium]